jgi:hypothetical protein
MLSETKPGQAALFTLMVCVLVGPLFGLVLTVAGLSFLPFARGFDVLDFIFQHTVIIASYFYSGIQALVFGVVMALFGKLRGVQPLWFVLVVATVLFVCSVQILGVKNSSVISVLGAASVISAWSCWLIFRRFWRVKA